MAEYLIPATASILIAVIEIIAAKDRKAAKEDSKKTEARAAVQAGTLPLSAGGTKAQGAASGVEGRY